MRGEDEVFEVREGCATLERRVVDECKDRKG